MIVRDGTLFIVAILAALAAVGWGAQYVTKVEDHPLEELTEEILENQIEGILGLPDDSLNIDLTPSSDERKT